MEWIKQTGADVLPGYVCSDCFVSLSVLVGIAATILHFVIGDIVSGFSDLFWTCINGWILAVTVGAKASEKENENDR